MTQLQSVSYEGAAEIKCLNFYFFFLLVKTNKLTIDPKTLNVILFCWRWQKLSQVLQVYSNTLHANINKTWKKMDFPLLLAINQEYTQGLNCINYGLCSPCFVQQSISLVTFCPSLSSWSWCKVVCFCPVFLSILYLKCFWTWLTFVAMKYYFVNLIWVHFQGWKLGFWSCRWVPATPNNSNRTCTNDTGMISRRHQNRHLSMMKVHFGHAFPECTLTMQVKKKCWYRMMDVRFHIVYVLCCI